MLLLLTQNNFYHAVVSLHALCWKNEFSLLQGGVVLVSFVMLIRCLYLTSGILNSLGAEMICCGIVRLISRTLKTKIVFTPRTFWLVKLKVFSFDLSS